jgi:tetratricopeptide (TPR) repeat protein
VIAPLEAWPKAEQAALWALENDNQLPEVHAVLALLKMGAQWDWAGAERACQRALALNPSCAIAHDYYAEYWTAMGQHEQAIAAIKRAQELDPLSLIINCDVGCNLLRARRFEDAIEQLENTVEMDPSFALSHWALGLAYEGFGHYQEALTQFEKAFKRFEDGPPMLAAMGHTYAACGKTREARNVLGKLLDASKQRYVSAYDIAVIYVGLQDADQAFAWLCRACSERPFDLAYLKIEPRFDPLRSDSRFRDLLNQMGFPQQQPY